MSRLNQKKVSYTFDYPQAVELSDKQMSIYWTADEINVEKDIQDIRVNMSEAEAHGVITTLRLFTLYELVAGSDYWLGRTMRRFPRPDIQRMASTFGFFELNVHAPFYNKINEALMINTDEFYLSYVDDPVLAGRMKFVEEMVVDKDDLLSVGSFTFIEGAVLYSSFAYLKHFQTRGKNKLMNVVRGINFSVRDENLHCVGGAWLYNTLKQEKLLAGEITHLDVQVLEEHLKIVAAQVYEHESRIVDMIFEKGEVDGITSTQMKEFVKSRVNICLEQLGIEPLFIIEDTTVAGWFYDNINSLTFHDFFSGVGNGYNRNWDETGFNW